MELIILESPVVDEACRRQIMSFIHGEAWQPFFNRELCEEDKDYKHWHLVLEEAGGLIAHCHVCHSLRHKDFGLFSFLEVRKEFQGRGLAKTVYREAMAILEGRGVGVVFLETDFRNVARNGIYLKDGFVDIFVSPDGAVAMVKTPGSTIDEYAKTNFRMAGGSAGRTLGYADYLVADVLLNMKLDKVKDKSRLPLNSYGKRGAYSLFREAQLFPDIKSLCEQCGVCPPPQLVLYH